MSGFKRLDSTKFSFDKYNDNCSKDSVLEVGLEYTE